MQNQHRINYQTSYFGNTVLYVVESVGSIADNEWLYVFGFATHILSFKARKPIGKTDIYNVLATGTV